MRGVKLRVRIVGDAGLPEHRRYQESLKNIAREEGLVDVEWVAAVPNPRRRGDAATGRPIRERELDGKLGQGHAGGDGHGDTCFDL